MFLCWQNTARWKCFAALTPYSWVSCGMALRNKQDISLWETRLNVWVSHLHVPCKPFNFAFTVKGWMLMTLGFITVQLSNNNGVIWQDKWVQKHINIYQKIKKKRRVDLCRILNQWKIRLMSLKSARTDAMKLQTLNIFFPLIYLQKLIWSTATAWKGKVHGFYKIQKMM